MLYLTSFFAVWDAQNRPGIIYIFAAPIDNFGELNKAAGTEFFLRACEFIKVFSSAIWPLLLFFSVNKYVLNP